MSNWFIVHFQPLERFPPAINFIRFVASQPDYKKDLHVVTVHPGKGRRSYEISDVTTHRLGAIKERDKIQRIFFYILFNIRTILLLLKYRPTVVLYYESLSGFAPLWYKKWVNKKARIFIHYHEYTSPEEYASGMLLNRLIHKRERAMYNKTTWVSHTNSKRMELFLHDIEKNPPPATFILPNFPPMHWINSASVIKRAVDKRIGFVYVGALSLNTMHTREMAEFVACHKEECYWDIYSDNHDEEAVNFLRSLNVQNINFKGAIPYNDLPLVLPNYDIGVILYTGNTPNYEYNAPNKFFEYYLCGLNVWFGEGMKGMYPYIKTDDKPFVELVNFSRLKFTNRERLIRIERLPEIAYTAEKVYTPLWEYLKEQKTGY